MVGKGRLWGVVFVLTALWGLLGFSGVSEATVAWNFSGGRGVSGEPFLLADAADLFALAERVNEGAEIPKDGGEAVRRYGDEDVFYAQAADIDLGGREWTPIGISQERAFNGRLSGRGRKITGLRIRDAVQDGVGLFGYTGASSYFYHVEVYADIEVPCRNVGGIAGVNGGEIFVSSAFGRIVGRENVGGVAGYNAPGAYLTSAFGDCTIDGSVDGTMRNVGGLVGLNAGEVNECGAKLTFSGVDAGEAIGGAIGRNAGNADIADVVLAKISGGTDLICVGGGVGRNEPGAIVRNSIVSAEIEARNRIGGFVGDNRGAILNCAADGVIVGRIAVGGFVGSTGTEGLIGGCISAVQVRLGAASDFRGGFAGAGDGFFAQCVWAKDEETDSTLASVGFRAGEDDVEIDGIHPLPAAEILRRIKAKWILY